LNAFHLNSSYFLFEGINAPREPGVTTAPCLRIPYA